MIKVAVFANKVKKWEHEKRAREREEPGGVERLENEERQSEDEGEWGAVEEEKIGGTKGRKEGAQITWPPDKRARIEEKRMTLYC